MVDQPRPYSARTTPWMFFSGKQWSSGQDIKVSLSIGDSSSHCFENSSISLYESGFQCDLFLLGHFAQAAA